MKIDDNYSIFDHSIDVIKFVLNIKKSVLFNAICVAHNVCTSSMIVLTIYNVSSLYIILYNVYYIIYIVYMKYIVYV